MRHPIAAYSSREAPANFTFVLLTDRMRTRMFLQTTCLHSLDLMHRTTRSGRLPSRTWRISSAKVRLTYIHRAALLFADTNQILPPLSTSSSIPLAPSTPRLRRPKPSSNRRPKTSPKLFPQLSRRSMPRLGQERISTTESGPTMKDSRVSRSKAISCHRTGLLRPRDEAGEVLGAIGWEVPAMCRVASSSRLTVLEDSQV